MSGRGRRHPRTRRPAVVGVNLPTFVERSPARACAGAPTSVVGVNLPTFVERVALLSSQLFAFRLSSGLTSRPSLSVRHGRRFRWDGVHLSSGLTSRPSLSALRTRRCRRIRDLSSGLTSRPSLSAAAPDHRAERRAAVVGVNLPTFVERGRSRARRAATRPAVVGVNLPTFVERPAPT